MDDGTSQLKTKDNDSQLMKANEPLYFQGHAGPRGVDGSVGPVGPTGSLFVIPLNLGIGGNGMRQAAHFRELLQNHLVSCSHIYIQTLTNQIIFKEYISSNYFYFICRIP